MSPTVFRVKGYRFYFFSRDISGSGGDAKFWLEPETELAMSHNLAKHEINLLYSIVREHCDELKNAWKEHLG